ncbi:MAG: M48 family metalloprotease [Cellvibrionaceae bacterium]|nr:M48 family metalloprotease [Cellvibrionaceae bacterium]
MLKRLSRQISLTITVTLAIAGTAGCSTNAVTGKSQIVMPLAQQIKIGVENYQPSQQQQGGRYTVDPDLGVYVNQVGQKVAAHSPSNLPYEFVVLNSDVPNAWALPGGKIAINRGLLTLLEDEAQLAAVLGHEVIHAAAEHGANQMAKAQMLNVGVLAAGVAASRSEKALLVGAGAALGAQAFQAHYGRSQELEADRYGIDLMIKAGYEPRAAVELQEKFVALSKGQKSDFLSNLFASHPPSQERVEKNKARTANLPQGKRNRAAYQRAIGQIVRDQAAYKARAEAEKVASEGDLAQGLSLVNKAIQMQSEEPAFYITKGQILAQQKNHAEAKKAYTAAVRKNPDYFMGHLGKGLSEAETGDKSAAKISLQSSMQQLKTFVGAYYLGEIYLAENNRQQAIPMFQYAAQSQGDLGKAAQARLSNLQ